MIKTRSLAGVFTALAMMIAVSVVTGCGSDSASNQGGSPEMQADADPSTVVYWGGAYGDALGRTAVEDKSTVILEEPDASPSPSGIAFGAPFVYWGQDGISRATVEEDGATTRFTAIEEDFIAVPGGSVEDLAIDDKYLYWVTYDGLGRAALDGGEADPNFISGTIGGLGAIAVNSEYIYWAGDDVTEGVIGRARLDGSEVDPSFMTGLALNNPSGLVATEEHLYWSGNESIGRADVDGLGPEPNFVNIPSSPDGSGPHGLAIADEYIYWGGYDGPIGRVKIDGSEPEPDFIDTEARADGVQSVAVSG